MIPQGTESLPKKSFDIKPNSTHFVEVHEEARHPMTLTLVEGEAEILGAEIMPNRPITILAGEGATIYSWTGCTIQCESESELPNEIGIGLSGLHGGYADNPMETFINHHFDLTEARKSALDNNVLGPRILILGDQLFYKKEIWTLFINYTTKMNMKPIFVDLDVDSSIFCNGFLGAVEINGQYPRDFFNYRNKMVYFSNYDKKYKKPYLLQIKTIAKNTLAKLNKELEKSKEGEMDCEYPSFCTGVIVNLPNITSIAYWKQLIEQTTKQFQITHCIVLEDKNTLAYLYKEYPSIQRLSVSKLDSMKPSFQSNQSKVDIYFNGDSKLNNSNTVQKFISEISINDVTLYELKISGDETPYCIKLDLKQMEIVKAVITIFHAKNDTTDEFALGNKVLTSPVCCLMRIHGIENGIITIHSIEENFMKLHKNSLWIYGKIV